MSDEEGTKYKNRDIVWVKLGSCWWPGEVTEDAPEDFTSKKPPLVIVKFFNEDTYEFVKTYNNIYHYNCDRKNEFIKKGMDSFRANNSHMEKFPSDVTLAEMRTEGNPNILSDPQFAPQKKTNVIAEVFGSPSPKKTPKDGNKHRSRPSTSKNSSKKPIKINITHRRFLGLDDYESHVRVQYPGKDNEHLSSDEDEIVRLNAEPSQTLNCSECTFSTNRIEVMLFHVQCHIKGINTSPIKKKITSPKKKKIRVPPKHITSEDDRTNSSTGCIDTDSEDEKPKPKRKKKTPTSSPKKTKVKKVEEEKTVVTDIRTNLLAEWSDSEDNEEKGESTSSKHDTSEEKPEEKETEKEEKKMDEQTSKDLKSCFDFDEEEEEEDIVQKTEHGRKIPRVIPPTDKRKSTDDSSLGDEENPSDILKESESLSENSNSVELAKQEEVFKVLMESTMVPDLPDVPDSSKPQQNFSDSKTVKIPDKEVATKLTNPKKRFVKSFEDFENFQNEQRKAQEEKEKAVIVERVETPVVDEEVPKVVEETPKIVEETPKVLEKTSETPPVVEETPPEPEVPKTEEVSDIFEKLDTNLQISKLKSQLMSKMSDDEPEITKPVKKTTSHRTPRSKILESYRNDRTKEKTRKSTEDEEEIKESFSPKKSKYLSLNKSEGEEEEEEKIEEETSKSSPKKSEYLKGNEEEEEEEKIDEETTKSDVIKEIEAIPEKNPDEEIGKINQIDDYLNDFLFNLPKKDEEEKKIDEKEEEPTPNEVQIPCASENGDSDTSISIKTNLSNFDKEESEMSALNTLAMVSQLETTVEKPEPPELVPIDGNLTVVSEKDLADAQVEITADSSSTCKKPVTLTNFSMDFSDSTSDSLASEPNGTKKEEVEEIKKVLGPDDIFDIEDHIPSQIVDKNKPPTSKLLERLTTTEPKVKDNSVQKFVKVPMTKDSTKITKTKFVIKPSTVGNKIIKGTTKPINILSEKIIKPVKPTDPSSSSVSVQKITSKRNLQDADEIDAFIIQKGAKNIDEEEGIESEEDTPVKKIKKSTAGMDPKKLQVSSNATSVKKRGKAKILQQTIITPAGEIIQPTVATTTVTPTTPAVTVSDDNVFDINSMPIVLSDQILTPESIENMPIYLSDSVQSTPEPIKVPALIKKTPLTVQQNQTPPVRVLNKSVASPATKLIKTPKIIGSVGSKFIKQNSFASGSSKHGKYVIVTQSPPTTTVSKYTVGKKQTFVKRVAGDLGISTAGTLTKVQNVTTSEPTGNKIMILTDDKGQQQRVLLTPAQQKMMGYQTAGAKLTKTVVKGNIIQKSKDGQMTAVPGSSGIVSKSLSSSRINSNQTLISSTGHVLGQIHPQQTKTMRIEKQIPTGRKIQMQSQKVPIKTPQQKTILIKNQHGQTVRKIQGTDDALLDKQVAEQLEAIKASGVLQQKQQPSAKNIRRSYAKKIESPKPQMIQKTKNENVVVPPLAPISPKKPEEKATTAQTDPKQERALHQLVIQDAMGNQTTITEGQILALPSETIDGQPQSYMLVTLDESGNLTPLNNEALLSLDPNLGLGGDLGNTVLQIDQNALKEETVVATTTTTTTTTPTPPPPPEVAKPPEPAKEEEKLPEVTGTTPPQEQIVDSSVMQTMGESGQQLIVTGDPIAAQKFLESLTEGNTDLANILASAEGSSILIHTDGQQILINTDSDNQMLLSVNTDNLNMAESSEGGGNPIFATQPAKNQDILAAALADTDVFQQEQNGGQGKVAQLSPNSALYPMNVGNVLETSLTLNSPIMTPLEVPSTNSKKITDENDILSQVPKNVDLPITITDPNISQTVSQQQVASLMVNELQGNLELSLPISEGGITVTSSEMNSPSFVYSLPSLDGADITQKPFNSSMPLLTEDTEEVSKEEEEDKTKPQKDDDEEEEEHKKISPEGSFLDESEGLCTLGGEMCSSLSEPPPDMFDLSAVLSSHQIKSGENSPKDDKGEGLVIMEEAELKIDDKSVSSESVNQETETSSPNTMNEDSCEIPVQPNIVTTLKEDELSNNKREGDELENDNKKCKFD